jgi:glc operon protein GlcG
LAKPPSNTQSNKIDAGWLRLTNGQPAGKTSTRTKTFMKISTVTAIAMVLVFTAISRAQIVEKKSLDLEGAKKAITAAVDYAKKNNAPGGVIAVVDEGGNLMALERLDGTFAMGATISIGKARTAVLFKKPTRFFEELINKGRTAMTAIDGFTPLIGGIPIVVDGQVVGGVGVSGAASANQDEELALAGANALMGGQAKAEAAPMSKQKPGAAIAAATAQTATFVDPKKVSAAFAKGVPLVETAGYKVHASRRVEPGQAEIHTLDTDVIYVVDGSATLVTGGKPVDTKEIAPNEIRGTKIEGGEEHQITKGEVIIIPNGVPHQFTAVSGGLHYFVCKPSALAETHLTAR